MIRCVLFWLTCCCLPAYAVPNIIVIVADDLSWHDLGCMGATDVLTPYIDTLAANGVRFTHAYATAPVCSPSRAGLLTGRYQQRFGQETNPGPSLEGHIGFGLPTTEATMGNRFKALGYATGWIGKSHLGSQGIYHPNNRGFDEFFGYLRSHHNYVDPSLPVGQVDPIQHNGAVVPDLPYLTVALGERCVQFIEDHHTQPFFLFAPFSAVHFDDNFQLPAPQTYHDRVSAVNPGPGIRHDMAAVLAVLDDAVGAILGKLQQHGILQNTLIFFTSDNGGDPTFGANNGGLNGGKTEVYEGGIRVPFLVHWKDTIPAGQVKAGPVSTLDILPTAIAATGNIVPAAWQLDGVNLMPWLMGQTAAPSRALFWRMETDGVPPAAPPGLEADVKDGLRAVRQDQWKLVKAGAVSSWELYNLAADPGETLNVADANASLVAQMVSAYEEWSAQMARPRWAWNNLNYATPEFIPEDIGTGPAGPYVEPPTAVAFQCPELNNETCTAQLAGNTSIVVSRNSGTPFATLSVPSRFLYSMKPRAFNGVTYFSCAACQNSDPFNPGTTEMWLLGLGPDSNHRLARRVDEAGGTDHHQPDTVVDGGELFFTYARGSQGRIARTGLKLSDHDGAATGFTGLQFSESFHASPSSSMHGTETTQLVVHQNRLFAGQSSVGVEPEQGGSFTGAQILRKDSALDDWVIEAALPAHRGVETLNELTFGPAKELVASFSDIVPAFNNIIGVRTRISQGLWEHSTIPSTIGGVVTCTASGGNLIFAGTSGGEIHRGVYAALSEQRFEWNALNPELAGVGEVRGLATANGVLYAACGLAADGTGGLYQRNDGTQSWSLVYHWLAQESMAGVPMEHRLMRGLTTVADPRGTTSQSLLAARSWTGVIERIDPSRDHAVTVELDVRDFFARRWNDDAVRSAGVIIGYNAFTPVSDPVTGELVHLINLWIDGDAHFLIRHANATYETADLGSMPGLRATRCFAVSPFGEDALYVGGFDNSISPGTNTAWIMRGDWNAWPAVMLTQPDPPLMQLAWPLTSAGWSVEVSGDLSLWQPLGGLPTRSLTTTTQSIDVGASSRGFFRLRRTVP